MRMKLHRTPLRLIEAAFGFGSNQPRHYGWQTTSGGPGHAGLQRTPLKTPTQPAYGAPPPPKPPTATATSAPQPPRPHSSTHRDYHATIHSTGPGGQLVKHSYSVRATSADHAAQMVHGHHSREAELPHHSIHVAPVLQGTVQHGAFSGGITPIPGGIHPVSSSVPRVGQMQYNVDANRKLQNGVVAGAHLPIRHRGP